MLVSYNYNAITTGDVSWKHLNSKKIVSMGSFPCLLQFSIIDWMFISFGKRGTALDTIIWPSESANSDSLKVQCTYFLKVSSSWYFPALTSSETLEETLISCIHF